MANAADVDTFVGRRAELARLDALLRTAAAGRPVLALLTGEPGAGKTALLQRFYSSHAEVRRVWAATWEGERQPPLWIWTQLAEQLGTRLEPGSDDSSDSARFRAVKQAASVLSTEQTLLVALDDLQWADPVSLEALVLAFRSLHDTPVLVVATLRDVDAGVRPDAELLLRQVRRLAEQLPLAGLTIDDVAELLESVGAEGGQAAAVRVHAFTGGHALFVRESAALPDNAPMPARVRDVLTSRIAGLSTREWNDAGRLAAFGVRVPLDLVPGADVAPLETARLGHVADRHWIWIHALMQSAVRDLDERRAAHALEAAQALRAVPGSIMAQAELLAEAGSLASAEEFLDVTLRAAHEARRGYDTSRSITLLQRAIPVLEANADLSRLVPTLCDLAEALMRHGDGDEAVRVADRAWVLAREAGDGTSLARAAVVAVFRSLPWIGNRQDVERLDEALARDDVPDVLRVHLQSRAAEKYARIPFRAQHRHEELSTAAVALAERTGDDAALRQALNSAFFANWIDGEERRLSDYADRAVALCRRSGDVETEAEHQAQRLAMGYQLLDPAIVASATLALAELRSKVRLPLSRFYVTSRLSTVACVDGRFDEARALLEEALALAATSGLPELNHPGLLTGYWTNLLMETEVALPAALDSYIDIVRANVEARNLLGNGILFAGLLGDHDLVTQLTERAMRPDRPGEMPMGASGRSIAVEAAVAAGLPAHELAQPLLAWQHLGAVQRSAIWVRPPVAHAVALGTGDETAARSALTLADRMRSGPWRARSLAVLASITSDSARSAAYLRDAAELAATLGMSRLLASLHVDLEAPARVTSGFVQVPEGWHVWHGTEHAVLKPSKGLTYLAHLVYRPGVEEHALDLTALTEGATEAHEADRRQFGSDLGPMLDEQARAAYKTHLEGLKDQIEDADALGLTDKADRLRAEMVAVARQLQAASGFGGRDRLMGSSAEKARLNVTRAIRTAIDRLSGALPSMGEHLNRSVRTGTYCVYDNAEHWVWERSSPTG